MLAVDANSSMWCVPGTCLAAGPVAAFTEVRKGMVVGAKHAFTICGAVIRELSEGEVAI